MADDILKNIPLPADLPENWTSGQIIAPTGAEAGLDDQHGYNYLMRQVNNAQKALKALAAQREEDLAKIKFWVSDDPASPASFIGGTWERIEDCTIWGASDTHPAGTTVEAGLPNITGYFDSRPHMTGNENAGGPITRADGKLFVHSLQASDKMDNSMMETDTSYKDDVVFFDASRSNPIYGASDTVQPPAHCMYIWRRVA
jgi:hypothetical protein